MTEIAATTDEPTGSAPAPDTPATFLARRSLRSASRRLTQMLVLGYGVATIVLVVRRRHVAEAFSAHGFLRTYVRS